VATINTKTCYYEIIDGEEDVGDGAAGGAGGRVVRASGLDGAGGRAAAGGGRDSDLDDSALVDELAGLGRAGAGAARYDAIARKSSRLSGADGGKKGGKKKKKKGELSQHFRA